MYLALFFQSDNFIRERISVVSPIISAATLRFVCVLLESIRRFYFIRNLILSSVMQTEGQKTSKKKKADFMKLSACVRLLIHLFAFFFIFFFFIFFFHFFSFSFLRKRTLESPCRLRSKFSKPEKHQQTDRLKEDYRNA